MSGLIAIVGRPNVGKSALFNRIVRKRIAIVHDQPGVTRDRVIAEAEWLGREFTLVDTGGIGLLRRQKAEDVVTRAAMEQVQIAIDSAQVILLVVNVQEGLVPLDREVAERLRVCGKPVLVAINKVDNKKAETGAGEFAALGFEKLFPVSAIHGEGVEALIAAALKLLPPESVAPDAGDATAEDADGSGKPKARDAGPLKLAIIGRPNVGKSSIINALTQSERVIVSPIPGTTRDAIDVPFDIMTGGVRQPCVLIDTAGVRKYRRIDDTVELFSVERTKNAIARCDMVIFVLDADAGITEQDKKIGDLITENRKACIIVVNKWDLVHDVVRKAREEEISRRDRKSNPGAPDVMSTLSDFGAWVQEHLFFLDYAPVIFASATTGFQLERLLEAVRYVAAQMKQQIPTSILNRTLHDAVERRQPASSMGLRLKFFYATQTHHAPPTFLMFVNREDLFPDQYKKYLAHEMRRAFGFEGCPLVFVPRARPKTVASVRRNRDARARRRRSETTHRSSRRTAKRIAQHKPRRR
ncbi:MAG: GTPase [Verrucomicrobiota bacterium]|jgi:GTP-binding protein